MNVAGWKIALSLSVALFAFFPLTDSDIWWHLASAREILQNGIPASDPFCWTPSRTPWIDIHLFFQLLTYKVFSLSGAFGLVVFKSFLWGITAYLWLRPVRKTCSPVEFSIAFVFAFALRYSFECRPVLATMIFLGIFWNLSITLLGNSRFRSVLAAIAMLSVEWVWVRTQGLFPLGWAMAILFIAISWKKADHFHRILNVLFFSILLLTPLLHEQGILLWKYPFALFDRLTGGTSASQAFSSEIAENRSPITLLALDENSIPMGLLLLGILYSAFRRFFWKESRIGAAWLFVTALLALVAERNAVLFLFPFVATILNDGNVSKGFAEKGLMHFPRLLAMLLIAFTAGLWCRTLPPYFPDGRFRPVSWERVPAGALAYLEAHPMAEGTRLFNDDRSGGYLEWNLPGMKTFADGRFILKDSLFMATYLGYSQNPNKFLHDADSLNIGRALFPIRYFTIWRDLDAVLSKNAKWQSVYRDSLYVVFDRSP